MAIRPAKEREIGCICPDCNGAGGLPGPGPYFVTAKCQTCMGGGEVIYEDEDGNELAPERKPLEPNGKGAE